MRDFTLGFMTLWRALPLLNKPGVKRYVIIPLLINIVLFVALFWISGNYFSELVDSLTAWLPNWLSWLSSLLWIVFALLAVLLLFFGFSFVINLVGSPFNGLLAAKLEQHLTGTAPPGSERPLWHETGMILWSEMKKWIYFAMWAMLILILSLVISPLAPLLWFFFSAWAMSLEYLDYPLGNHGLVFSDIRQHVATRRLLYLGFGSAVTVALLIPIFNLLVMPLAVAGATLLQVEQSSRNNQLLS